VPRIPNTLQKASAKAEAFLFLIVMVKLHKHVEKFLKIEELEN